MKTSLPTALIYGWNKFGEIKIQSDVYWEENLQEDVILYSYESSINFKNTREASSNRGLFFYAVNENRSNPLR